MARGVGKGVMKGASKVVEKVNICAFHHDLVEGLSSADNIAHGIIFLFRGSEDFRRSPRARP